jgi:hypothetical protein
MVNQSVTGPARVSSATAAPVQDSLFEIIWRRKMALVVCAVLAVAVAYA